MMSKLAHHFAFFLATLLAIACLINLVSANSQSSSASLSQEEAEMVIAGEQEASEKAEFANILVRQPEHHEDPPKVDPDSNLSAHEAMRCHVCRHAVKPAIVNVIKEKAGKTDHREMLDEALRKLATKHIWDLESRSVILREDPGEAKFTDEQRDENIHHFIEHLLWDEHMAAQIYAFADVYVQQPKRRHWFTRLVDHILCPCHDGKEVRRLDHGIDKYFMNHVAATMEVMKKYKLGHDIFTEHQGPWERPSSRIEKIDARPEDANRQGQGTNLGTIYVDSHGHLDEHYEQKHGMEPIRSEFGAHELPNSRDY
jgi:hypothetical protein